MLLNLVHFILEFIALISLPVFATLLIDKKIILNKFQVYFSLLFWTITLFYILGIFLFLAFIIKNLF